MVYNKTTSKLKSATVKNPKDEWVRTPEAFDAVVDQDIFQAAQDIIEQQRQECERMHSEEDMILRLQGLYQHRGYISARQITVRDDMLSPHSYATKFKSLDMAFQNMFPDVMDKTKTDVMDFLKTGTNKVEPFEDYVVLDDSFSVLIQPSVPIPYGYSAYWSFLPDPRLEIDVTLGVPLSNSNEYNILGFMAFPRILTRKHNIRVFDTSESLLSFYGYQDLELIQTMLD